jgi:hypothetical protein
MGSGKASLRFTKTTSAGTNLLVSPPSQTETPPWAVPNPQKHPMRGRGPSIRTQLRLKQPPHYPVGVVDNVFHDETHRTLARSMLVSACAARSIEVAEVEFGSFRRDDAYSWLCYLVNPAVDGMIVDGLIGSLTEKSAADHFLRYGFNRIMRSSGKRIAINVHELETSSEATLELYDEDGEDLLIQTWQGNLLVVRAKFTIE